MHKALLAQGGKNHFVALLRRVYFNATLGGLLKTTLGGLLKTTLCGLPKTTLCGLGGRGALVCVAAMFAVAAAQAQIFSDDEARAAAAENTKKIATLGRVMNNLRTQLASMLQQQQVLEQDLRELSGQLEKVSGQLEKAATTIQSAKGLRESVDKIGEQQNVVAQEVSGITAQISLISERLLQDDVRDMDGQLHDMDGQLIALSIKLSSLGEQMSELVDIVDIPSENDMYGVAFSTYQRRDYPTAINGFQKVVRYYPQGAFALNARYWMAQALLANGDYAEAEKTATEIINNHADSDKVPETLLALARAQQGLEKAEAWVETLNRLIENYPTSLAADKARQMLLP